MTRFTPTFLKPSHFPPTCLWRWNRHFVPKRRHIKFRRRGITQEKAYNNKKLLSQTGRKDSEVLKERPVLSPGFHRNVGRFLQHNMASHPRKNIILTVRKLLNRLLLVFLRHFRFIDII